MLDQQMIEADLAELVDDHRRLREHFVLQQAIEQRGLAGAEKAGEHRERDWRWRNARPRARLAHCLVDFGSGFFAAAVFGFGSGALSGFPFASAVSLASRFFFGLLCASGS